MTQNVKAADLIGKTINVKDSTNYYVVKSADGETLQTEMHMGERTMPCPMPMTLLRTMLEAGKYIVGGDAPATAEPIAEDPNGEPDPEAVGELVYEPKSEDVKPMAQTVTLKRKVTLKKKQTENPTNSGVGEPGNTEPVMPTINEPVKPNTMGVVKPEAEPTAKRKLRYETYENKKGKTCAKITGFDEGDAMLNRENAERIHASSTYERDKKGDKHFMLIFGPRYAAAAKDVCKAMNQGKTLADCQAIIDQATEERTQRREEWKAKRAAYLATKEGEGAEVKPETVKPETKQGYSSEDLINMLSRVLKGDVGVIPEDIRAAVLKAA